MARIVCKISCVAIFNLLFTAMFTDGIMWKQYEENPIVGRPFKVECNTETKIVATVDIKTPDDTIIGSCIPASPPHFPATCDKGVGYEASLNESAYTIQVNTSSLASDVNGTWVCLHDGQMAKFTLDSPVTEIIGERLHLTPFTKNITTTSVSLTATYECINIPVYFKWYVEDESPQEKTELEFANTVIEKNCSLCMNYSGFDAYTETRSSSSVPNRDGRYRIGVEVHYSGEVTALLSIQYFDTYFFSSEGTDTNPDNDSSKGLVIGVVIGVIVVVSVSVLVVVLVVWMKKKKKKFLNNDASEKSRSQSCISLRNGTVTPDERQQPDGDEGIQSTPTEIHARLSTTPRPLPPRPDIASKPQGTMDSLNSHIPIVLAPIENPNIPPSIDTLDEQKTYKKPKDKKKKKKKKKYVEQDNPGQ